MPGEEDIHRLQYSEAKLVSITTPASTSGGGLSERIRQVALISIPILLLGLLLLNIFDRNHFRSFPKPETSIAVLPFDNLSREPDSEYFSDGVTEEILALLSHIEGLRVVSSNSIMQLKIQKNRVGKSVGNSMPIIFSKAASVATAIRCAFPPS